MGNVWEAMKKHEAEEAERAQQPDRAEIQAVAGTVRAPSDAGRVEPVPTTMTGDGYAEALVAHNSRGSRITEEYRALRTSLLASSSDGRFCYLVTSAEPSEGKTVTCTFTNTKKLLPDSESITPELDCVLFKDGQPDVAY